MPRRQADSPGHRHHYGNEAQGMKRFPETEGHCRELYPLIHVETAALGCRVERSSTGFPKGLAELRSAGQPRAAVPT